MSHGIPRHRRISNVFEPIELLKPIAPWPRIFQLLVISFLFEIYVIVP